MKVLKQLLYGYQKWWVEYYLDIFAMVSYYKRKESRASKDQKGHTCSMLHEPAEKEMWLG